MLCMYIGSFHVLAPLPPVGQASYQNYDPSKDLSKRNRFSCKGLAGEAVSACIILTNQYLNDYHTLYNNNTICILQRVYDIHAPYSKEMSVLSTTPAIWHGVGNPTIKAMYKRYADAIVQCHRRRMEG